MTNYEFIERWFEGNYSRRSYCNLIMDSRAVYSYGRHFPLVMRCRNGYVLNGDTYSWSTSRHQYDTRVIAEHYPDQKVVIPYSALDSANVSQERITILDRQRDQWREVRHTNPDTGEEEVREEHMLGGSVIRMDRRYFVSSTDPTAFWRFGYFLTELPHPVRAFDRALESLKPGEVMAAEAQGREVQRQGEYFFVPVDDKFRQYTVKKWIALPSRDGRAGHHVVRDAIRRGSAIYARGTVRHTGNIWTRQPEHRMTRLRETWHKVLHNRQKGSWGASGRID